MCGWHAGGMSVMSMASSVHAVWRPRQDVKEQKDDELVVLETDNVLYADEGFRCALTQLHGHRGHQQQLCNSAYITEAPSGDLMAHWVPPVYCTALCDVHKALTNT